MLTQLRSMLISLVSVMSNFVEGQCCSNSTSFVKIVLQCALVNFGASILKLFKTRIT